MQAKLITTFSNLSEPNFLAKAQGIVNALRNNPNFPEPWLPQVGSFADLKANFDAYQKCFSAAANGDRARIDERDAAREALQSRLRALAPYLEAVAAKDTTKLNTAGYDLRKDIVRSPNKVHLSAPSDFTAKHGTISGQVVLHAARLPGAKSYVAEYTDGNPHDPATAWVSGGIFTTCSRMEITGLVRGKEYWFRVCGVNKAGQGAWTDLAGLMAL
jgi:hypothetical protein